ncbi:hypothetical protein [Oceanobacillus saliphilus]|nr:hypothetical protein [Oceanobacillus saliphilus]
METIADIGAGIIDREHPQGKKPRSSAKTFVAKVAFIGVWWI